MEEYKSGYSTIHQQDHYKPWQFYQELHFELADGRDHLLTAVHNSVYWRTLGSNTL